jgi:hypothetical protein
MATHPQERRQHSERRRGSTHVVDDLHQRLEEKRKQLDRRQSVRRESDRRSSRRSPPEPGPTPHAGPRPADSRSDVAGGEDAHEKIS